MQAAALKDSVRLRTGKDRDPTRRCIVTGEVRPKRELLRFVVGPDGRVVPDIRGRLPGRGLWLRPARHILARAQRRGLFAKAAGSIVQAPEDLGDQVAALLRRRCLDLIGLARRAGDVVVGYEKVKASLEAGRAAVLLAAGDGADQGRRKLRRLAAARGGGLPLIEAFSSAELGAALGRERAVHAALRAGDLAKLLCLEARRLESVLADTGGDADR